MSYLKKFEQYESVPFGLNQVFYHNNITMSKKNELINKKLNGEINNMHIEIVRFIFKRRFATPEQILKYCDINGFFYKGGKVDIDCLNAELDKLKGMTILNTFFLSSEEQPAVLPIAPEDAEIIYCAGYGAYEILTNYASEAVYGWDETSMCRDSASISRNLCVTQWHVNILESVRENLTYIRTEPDFIVKSGGKIKGFMTAADFLIKKDNEARYFIVDAFRDLDSPDYIREKLNNVNSLLTTKAYLRYYPDAARVPDYIIVADNETTLLNIATEMSNITKLKPWYSMDTLLNKSLKNDKPFLIFNENEKAFTPTGAKVFM